MTKHRFLLLVAMVILVSLHNSRVCADEAEIVVVGYGTAYVMPDRATIEIGISTVCRTAQQAADSSSAVHSNVLEALKAAGFDEQRMESSSYSVSPVYPMEQGRNDKTKGPEAYSADHRITVWIDDFDKIGKVVDLSLAAGATFVSVSLTSSKLEDARRSALEDAARQARADAEALAKSAGAKLGSLVTLTTHIPREDFDYGMPVGASRADETSIMPRQLKINARVLGKWKLQK